MELTSDKPLFHCKVKYIGSAEPTRKVQGIEAVQEPLRSVYGCVDNDIDKLVSGEENKETDRRTDRKKDRDAVLESLRSVYGCVDKDIGKLVCGEELKETDRWTDQQR